MLRHEVLILLAVAREWVLVAGVSQWHERRGHVITAGGELLAVEGSFGDLREYRENVRVGRGGHRGLLVALLGLRFICFPDRSGLV